MHTESSRTKKDNTLSCEAKDNQSPLQVDSPSILGCSVVSVPERIELQVSDLSKDNDWVPFIQHSCILIIRRIIKAQKSTTVQRLLLPCSVLSVSTGMLAISHSGGNMHSAHECYKSALSPSWQSAEDWSDQRWWFEVCVCVREGTGEPSLQSITHPVSFFFLLHLLTLQTISDGPGR